MSRWLEIFRTGRFAPAAPGDRAGPGDTEPGDTEPGDTGESGDAVPERTDGTEWHATGAGARPTASREEPDPASGLPAGDGAVGMNGTNGTGNRGGSGGSGLVRRPDPVPGDPASWRRWYRRHVVLRSCLPREQAERRAYGLAQVTWHRHHGERPDPALCAGCGAPLAGRRALRFDGAASVHFDEEAGLDCVIRFGARWRGAAERGLRQMGIPPPRGWSN